MFNIDSGHATTLKAETHLQTNIKMGDETWNKAQERLSQVQKHMDKSKPKTSTTTTEAANSSPSRANTHRRRTRRKQQQQDELPADYSDILSQIKTLQSMAATPDLNNRGYQRQKKAGKLWVRERVEAFVDPGTFKEVGSVSGTVKWRQLSAEREEPEEFIPSNNVQGFGKLNGRNILFTADDYSIRAGHADGSLAAKTVSVFEILVKANGVDVHGGTVVYDEDAND
jgi:Ulp1 family protease